MLYALVRITEPSRAAFGKARGDIVVVATSDVFTDTERKEFQVVKWEDADLERGMKARRFGLMAYPYRERRGEDVVKNSTHRLRFDLLTKEERDKTENTTETKPAIESPTFAVTKDGDTTTDRDDVAIIDGGR